jgi:hypothetical protein
MGWWKVQGTEHMIGDVPMDILGDALNAVVTEYQAELGRRPTKAEWEALLRTVLGNEMPDFRCIDEGIVERVSIKLK